MFGFDPDGNVQTRLMDLFMLLRAKRPGKILKDEPPPETALHL